MLLLSVTGGLIALAVVLIIGTAAGLALRRRSGRFRPAPALAPAGGSRPLLTAADLGAPLGRRATLVQFSTTFCAPCRPTRQLLAHIAGQVDGVAHIDIDATARLDLAQRLKIATAPTVLVLDADGGIVRRAAGLPRKPDVLAALNAAIGTLP